MTLFCFSKASFAAVASWYDVKAPQRTRNQVPLPGSSVGRTKVPSYFLAKASASSRVGNAESCSVYLFLGFAGSAATAGLGAAADGGLGAASATSLGAAGAMALTAAFVALGLGAAASASGLGTAGARGFGAAAIVLAEVGPLLGPAPSV